MFINEKYRAILSFSESFSWYFHLATVNSRGVIVMVRDILKRLDTIFKACGTDGLGGTHHCVGRQDVGCL